MGPPNTLSPRVHLLIYHRRTDRDCSCKLFPRHRPARHILRSCPLPLRPVHRRCLCHPSRIHPLIPPSHRIHPAPNMSKSPLRSNVYRSKPNILPATLPRPSRNAPTVLRLPRRLHTVKHYLLYRLPNFNSSRNHADIYYLRSLLGQTKSPTARTNRHKHRMNPRLPSPIPHFRRTSFCPSTRKEGIEPPYTGFKPAALTTHASFS